MSIECVLLLASGQVVYGCGEVFNLIGCPFFLSTNVIDAAPLASAAAN